jgi:hypothetical protein
MSQAEVGANNIIMTVMKHLSKEQKKQVDDAMEHY